MGDQLNPSPEEYGQSYQEHYLKIYEIYANTADKVSDRRQTANNFFLTLNTVLVTFTSYIGLDKPTSEKPYWLISLTGIVICYLWYRSVKSYRDLNTGKFHVINSLENQLPIAPYSVEWQFLGKGKDTKRYLPSSDIESLVPGIFFLLHCIILFISIF